MKKDSISEPKVADATENKIIKSWGLTKRVIRLSLCFWVFILIVIILSLSASGVFSGNMTIKNWIGKNWIQLTIPLAFSIFLVIVDWFYCYIRVKSTISE